MTKGKIPSICLGLVIAFLGFLYARPSVEIVHLAYMVDGNYLPYMITSLNSAKLNKDKSTEYHVHVIAQDFTKGDITKLQKMSAPDVKINIYPAHEINLDISHLGRFASFKISLQKLYLSEYLKNLDKVLYLDADTLVQQDLSDVYQTPLNNYYIAAVKDGLMYQHPEHIAEIGLSNRNFYFNSGVMLLNLKKMREDNTIKSATIYFNTHQEVFGDQDVLNVVLGKKALPLSYRYNVNSTFFEEKSAEFLSEFYDEKVPDTPQEVYKNAAILHFAGHKPWTPHFTHTYLKFLWEDYANKMMEKDN